MFAFTSLTVCACVCVCVCACLTVVEYLNMNSNLPHMNTITQGAPSTPHHMLHTHSQIRFIGEDFTQLYEHIPQDQLPEEFGGTGPPFSSEPTIKLLQEGSSTEE